MAKEIRKDQESRGEGGRKPAVRTTGRAVDAKPPAEIANAWAIAIFLVIVIAFFWGHLFGGTFLWEDFAEFTYPNEVFAARSSIAGIIPFWNPFTFNGMPFLADLQIGYFYPPNQIMYLLSGGNLSAWLAQFFVILHYPLAMFGAWKLASWIGIRPWGAIFTGITYGLSGIIVAHMIHPNMVHHLAWFPLIVYFFYRAVDQRSWLHSLLAGITLGVALLSGHPQSALYIIFFLFCLTVFLLVRDYRFDAERRSTIIRAGLAALLPVIIGVGMFAIQLLPSQELAGLSERATMTYEKSLEGAMSGSQLLTLIVPKVFGVSSAEPRPDFAFWLRPETYYYWETAEYIGVAALILAVVGLASRRLGALGWFLGGMGLLGVLYGLGDSFIIHPILSKLPLFGTFRSPARMALFFSLGGALLAGLGLERVIRADYRPEYLSRIALVAGGLVILIGILTVSGVIPSMLGAPEQVIGNVSGSGLTAVLIGGLTTALIWYRLAGRMPGTGAAIALLMFGVVDLFIFGVRQNVSLVNPQDIYQANDAQFSMFKMHSPDSLFRLKMREQGAMLMQRNQGPYSNIMLFEGYNPLLLERRVPPAATPEKAFDFMNIRYAVQVDPNSGQPGIVERPTAYPHARMMYDARVGSTQEVLAMLKSDSIDFGRTVLLEKEPGIKLQASGTGSARITRYDASEIEVRADGDRPGVLLLSEVWYPAWKVFVDGKQQDLLVADYSLRGVALPAGAHTVVMRYQSEAFTLGMWITIVTSILAIGAAILLFLRGRKGAEPAPAV